MAFRTFSAYGAACAADRPGNTTQELFAAIAEHASSSTNLGELRGHHPENLISGIVAVRIVEALEPIDVAHGDRVRLSQLLRYAAERAPAEQAGQLVAVGDVVAVVEYRQYQNQTRRT